jgi:hypothetical protein
MANEDATDLLTAAEAALPAASAALLRPLHEFTQARLEAARRRRQVLLTLLRDGAGEDVEQELHSLLRECWEALDGLAREVNVCMQHLFPAARLYPPETMTRQCTFYVIRKKLHEHSETAGHPVSRLLWDSTRATPAAEYERLRFLYNLSLFIPLRLVGDGELPGVSDVPPAARLMIKPVEVTRCGAEEGLSAIVEWLDSLLSECYRRLSAALTGTTR